MLSQRNSSIRVIGIVLILLLMMVVGGCGRSKPSSDPRSTPSGTLDELQKAIRNEGIDAMLVCYTEPFYLTGGGETTTVSHDMARIAYALSFAFYDYSTWSLVDRSISVSGSDAVASCIQRMYIEDEGGWVSGPVMYRMCRVESKWYIYEEIGTDPGYDLNPSARMKGLSK